MEEMQDTSSDFLTNYCKDEYPNAADQDFFFETDFLALKGNADYLKLMKTLAVLEVQRTRLSQSIDQLEELRIQAYNNPEGVKEKILSNEASYLFRCNIEKVPEIDWTKYKTFNGKNPLVTRSRTKPKENAENVTVGQSENHIKVRGRVYNEEKPETFNQLWTVEEQLRLEALLVEFPPEPVENRRWKKIAEALGNRTTQQVCSRVQKYFKKLQKVGLQVPGTSKRYKTHKRQARHVHKRHKHYLYKPSSFFPGTSVAELEGGSESDSSSSNESADMSHWNEILTVIKDEKNDTEKTPKVHHYGYKCTRCSECPIVGLRWECCSCPSTSMCSDCMIALMEDSSPPSHPLTHHYKPIKVFVNSNYSSMVFSTNNYLDPNFIA